MSLYSENRGTTTQTRNIDREEPGKLRWRSGQYFYKGMGGTFGGVLKPTLAFLWFTVPLFFAVLIKIKGRHKHDLLLYIKKQYMMKYSLDHHQIRDSIMLTKTSLHLINKSRFYSRNSSSKHKLLVLQTKYNYIWTSSK